MFRSLIPLSLLLTVFDTSLPVHGLRLPFTVRTGSFNNHVDRRSTTIPIANIGNAQYVSNITLAGVQVPVLLDTGSSDLWVHFPDQTPTTKDVGKSVSLAYAVGRASGNVHTAALQFDEYTVQDQAFLLVADTSTFTGNIHAQGYDGLLGLGPNKGSVIRKKLDGNTGDSMLARIFEADHSVDPYLTILLDRKGDPTDPFTGQLTIAELAPGFENITSMPKLDVEKVSRILQADQHWQALTDKNNGIIGPDGLPIKVDSIVPKAPDGQLVAVFDSGFTFSQVPREVSDAIYGRVRGAYYDSKEEFWMVPCGQMLNLTFMFGGRPYPIHPVDVVDDNFRRVDMNGNKICLGAFQPITSAFSLLGHYDMIMGMSFLRNAYTLLDFGDWVVKSNDRSNPYIQLASVTNVEQAYNDFVQVRLGGLDTTSDAKWSLLPVDQMQHSPVSDEEKKKKYQEMVLSRWPYILTGCLVFVLLLIGLCIWRCCCRKGGSKKKSKVQILPFSAGKEAGESEAYLPLNEQNRSLNRSHSLNPQYPGGGNYPNSTSRDSLVAAGNYPNSPSHDTFAASGKYSPSPQYGNGGNRTPSPQPAYIASGKYPPSPQYESHAAGGSPMSSPQPTYAAGGNYQHSPSHDNFVAAAGNYPSSPPQYASRAISGNYPSSPSHDTFAAAGNYQTSQHGGYAAGSNYQTNAQGGGGGQYPPSPSRDSFAAANYQNNGGYPPSGQGYTQHYP